MYTWICLAVFCVLFIYNVFTLPPYKPYEIVFEGTTGMMTYSKSGLMIYCYKQNNQHISMTDAFPPSNTTLSFDGVTIGQCLPINTSYVEEFKALNINSTINSLVHTFNTVKPLPPGNYTEGLTIEHLSIVNEHYTDIFINTLNFLEPLTSLKSMYVSGIEIPPLPKTMRLINLTLSDGSSIKNWGNCQYLKRFSLSNFDKTEFPVWPKTCTRLEYLEIQRLLPETALNVAQRMIDAAPSLHSIKMNYCRLHKLPTELIRSAKQLVYLDLSDNVLYDESFLQFSFHNSLKTLDLSSNLIRGHGLATMTPKLPSLVELVLKYEDKFNCHGTDFLRVLQNSSIESLDLSYTHMNVECFEGIHFSNMKCLTINALAGNKLKLLQLPPTNAVRLEVNFDYKIYDEILFDKADYETLQRENSTSPFNGYNLTVNLRYIPCDCKHSWLARALRDFPHIISMPTLRCDGDYGKPILEEPIENLGCNKSELNGCLYRQSYQYGTVTAECDKEAWVKMDPMYPLLGLNVSGQDISTLHTILPDSLQWVDLRHNRISRASAEQAAALFAAGRRVWLADNLLLCDCDNRALIDAIQLHKEQIEDYDLLKCVGTGQSLSFVSTDELCQVALIISLAVSGVLVLIAGVIAALLRRYGEQLRMFLYSRGLCLRCLQRQDLDDKPYDAFLSFAHEDREFVMETLLPGLENAPEKFRICVHYRDWVVGDWIPAQIMRSVQLSKRTLILLSRNFVASAWSTLELRYSLANLEEDTNAKVLVLIKDDVLDMDLDINFRRYLSYNTYLSCDDPWFWEKLRYAMPHRVKTNSLKEDTGTRIQTDEIIETTSDVAVTFPNSTDRLQEDNASHVTLTVGPYSKSTVDTRGNLGITGHFQ